MITTTTFQGYLNGAMNTIGTYFVVFITMAVPSWNFPTDMFVVETLQSWLIRCGRRAVVILGEAFYAQ